MSVSFQVYRGSPTGEINTDTVTRELQGNEVYIETTHSGVCGTDELYVKRRQVLGHEGIGIVRRLGSNVKSVKVGDRVGFGYVRKICGACDDCRKGWDQYCRKVRVYGKSDFDIGSFSHGTIWDASCLFPIPDDYPSEDAAPLLCAGASVWSCLSHFGARSSERVGILGVGGLGHLAIKIAAAMGCHVVVLSSSESKREDAIQYGASEFHVFDGVERIPCFTPLKHLLLCGSYMGHYASLIPLMDTKGTIYPLTVSLDETPVPLTQLINRGVRIQGSLVASRQDLLELLEFASRKRITPTIEKFPMTKEGIEEAMGRLRDGKIRYRAVLVREWPNENIPNMSNEKSNL